MLKNTFIELAAKYTDNKELIIELWNEIEESYSDKERYYHNLHHLSALLELLTEVKSAIQNWEAVLFTLYYHDIIYDPLKSNNEQKSAALAEKRLQQVNTPVETTALCTQHILATKLHEVAANSDTNYFTDADLSVLGQSPDIYTLYYKNIRKEYAFYPDLIYKPGRKKVLSHFLSMGRIFKTEYFYNKFEAQARENLQNELTLLN